jgi:enterochelin esterase family protein
MDSSLNSKLKVFWISCGREDRLFAPNQKLVGWLNSKGVKVSLHETSGMHTWMVWRRNLTDFASLIFRDQPAAAGTATR